MGRVGCGEHVCCSQRPVKLLASGSEAAALEGIGGEIILEDLGHTAVVH